VPSEIFLYKLMNWGFKAQTFLSYLKIKQYT
jgi:hypothetical protein